MSYNEGTRTFIAEEAITRGQRVKLGATAGYAAVVGAGEVGIGFSDRTVAIAEAVPVRLDSRTSTAIASGTVAFGATVYAAAAGAVSTVASGNQVGTAITAGTDGNEFEVMPQTLAS